MAGTALKVALEFSVEDRSWLRVAKVVIPRFFEGHDALPMQGDVMRLGGRQFTVAVRVWEHDANGPLLRVYLGGGHAESDTTFGSL